MKSSPSTSYFSNSTYSFVTNGWISLFIDRKPVIEWYVVRYGSKNRHQEDMITILSLIVNVIDHLMSRKNIHSDDEEHINMSSEN